jgi:predicted dehydrogenase
MSFKKLNVAVIGCGYWGPNLIRNFGGLTDDCTMQVVCDQNQDRLNHMKRLYPGVETTKRFEDIINSPEIDAVAIATPVRYHYALAKECLRAGKHTFIEKPMASSVVECQHLVSLAEENNLTLMVGHTFIYSAPVRYMRELIQSGTIGEIYSISARRLNLGLFQKDINVAWDLAPHDISIILYVLDAEPVSVNCQGKAHLNGQEDATNMSLEFDNGAFATIQSSWLDPNKVREMTIVGSKKMVIYDDTQPNEKIRIYDKSVKTPPHYDTFAEFTFSYHYGDMLAPYIQQVEPLKVECKHFLDCIRTGETPESSGLDGLRVVQILESSTASLRNGGSRVELTGHWDPIEFFGKCDELVGQTASAG